MKSATIALAISLLNIPFPYLPKVSLLVMMCLAMTFDFVTGVTKAYILKRPITSKALRRTVTKFLQYGGAILIGISISYMSNEVGQSNETWKYAPSVMNWFNNGLIIFIITIEVRSIVENLAEMDKNSIISKKLFRPALTLLNIKLDDNPIATMTIETDKNITVTKEEIPATEKQ